MDIPRYLVLLALVRKIIENILVFHVHHRASFIESIRYSKKPFSKYAHRFVMTMTDVERDHEVHLQMLKRMLLARKGLLRISLMADPIPSIHLLAFGTR